jgi:hypothetical protein
LENITEEDSSKKEKYLDYDMELASDDSEEERLDVDENDGSKSIVCDLPLLEVPVD